MDGRKGVPTLDGEVPTLGYPLPILTWPGGTYLGWVVPTLGYPLPPVDRHTPSDAGSKNNIAQLYVIQRASKLCLNFPVYPGLALVFTVSCLPFGKDPLPVGKLWNIRTIPTYAKNLKCNSDVLCIKYNCAVLFLR